MINKKQEQISEITSARSKKIQMDSTVLCGKKFSKKMVIRILINNSKTCEKALLYAFLTALK